MTLIYILVATVLVSSVSLVGGLLLLNKNLLSQKYLALLVSFAAGAMLATAFFDVLPEALSEAADFENICLFIFLGIITFFFLERFLIWFHHHDDLHDAKPTTTLILLGDGAHNFIDGIAIAASFLAGPGVGISTTLAVIAHEVPQEIADFSILISGGLSKTKALFYNFLSALTAILGAVLGFYFLENIAGVLPLSLAFTGGMFIYISCSDLIPELHTHFTKQKNWLQTLPFIMGIMIIYLLTRLIVE